MAHGDQVISDLSTIDLEDDPAECAVLKAGFENLYAVSLCLRHEFLQYKALMDLMNIHGNLTALEVFSGKSQDIQTCAILLQKWIEWVAFGSVLTTYPFITDQAAVVSYGSLMKLCGYGNPPSSRA